MQRNLAREITRLHEKNIEEILPIKQVKMSLEIPRKDKTILRCFHGKMNCGKIGDSIGVALKM